MDAQAQHEKIQRRLQREFDKRLEKNKMMKKTKKGYYVVSSYISDWCHNKACAKETQREYSAKGITTKIVSAKEIENKNGM